MRTNGCLAVAVCAVFRYIDSEESAGTGADANENEKSLVLLSCHAAGKRGGAYVTADKGKQLAYSCIALDSGKLHSLFDIQHLVALGEFKDLFQVVPVKF